MTKHFLFATGALVCAVIVVTNAGQLDPPAGPIGKTYKTLDEVEARTVLTPVSGQQITIDAPGSYVLGGDMTVSGNAIVIQASGVTLDLNGFTITGAGDAVAGTGIRALSTVGDTGMGPVVIRNGSVLGFANAGIRADDTRVRTIVEDIVTQCGTSGGIRIAGDGIVRRCVVQGTVQAGTLPAIAVEERAVIESCIVDDVPDDGIRIRSGRIAGCEVTRANAGITVSTLYPLERAVTIENCTVSDCFEEGFLINADAVLRDCAAHDNLGDGFRLLGSATLENCVSVSNGNAGFTGADNAVFHRCVARSNAGTGFFTGDSYEFQSCIADGNTGFGFSVLDSGVIAGSASTNNAVDGFSTGAGARITDSVATHNGANGFRLGTDSYISGCTADNNGQTIPGSAGILGNSDTRIENNNATDNPIGIRALTGALVVRNSCAGNTTDYDIAGANSGPISSDAATSTSPWTNFDF